MNKFYHAIGFINSVSIFYNKRLGCYTDIALSKDVCYFNLFFPDFRAKAVASIAQHNIAATINSDLTVYPVDGDTYCPEGSVSVTSVSGSEGASEGASVGSSGFVAGSSNPYLPGSSVERKYTEQWVMV